MDRQIGKSTNGSRSTCKIINAMQNKIKNNYIVIMEGVRKLTTTETVNNLNEFFSESFTIANVDEEILSTNIPISADAIFISPTTESDVKEMMASLKNSDRLV